MRVLTLVGFRVVVPSPGFATVKRRLKIKQGREIKIILFHLCNKLSRLPEKLTNVLFVFLVINIIKLFHNFVI